MIPTGRLNCRTRVFRQQRPAVRQHLRVIIHVTHGGKRVYPLCDLVHVVRGGQARAEVKELVDAELPRHIAHGTNQAGTIIKRDLHRTGEFLGENRCDHPVGGKVVFPAEQVIIGPRDARHFRIKCLRHTAMSSPGD
jgi:hypothetical protein